MHLRFDANQDYQLAAMAAVVRLFEGQARVDSALEFPLSAAIAAVPNRLDLSVKQLLANLIMTIDSFNKAANVIHQSTDRRGTALPSPRDEGDTTDLTRLRPEEAMKVRCGQRHFGGALAVSYRVVKSAADLR